MTDTDTDSAAVRRASLAALKGWAARRDRLPEHRADLLAAAWWSGTRNVAELARTADVTRDTVYDDLRSRGIEPKDRTTATEPPRPRYEPLRAEAVHELSELAAQALLPAQLVEKPDPLASAAWQMSTAYARIAVLLDESESGRHVEMAEDLASKLRDALRYAHAHWASLQSTDRLAARTSERDLDLLDFQAVAGGATLQLSLPVGRTITVTLGEEDYRSPTAGWTTVHSDSELLDATISGADHVAIKDALDTIAEVLTAHLRDDAFETDSNPSSFPSAAVSPGEAAIEARVDAEAELLAAAAPYVTGGGGGLSQKTYRTLYDLSAAVQRGQEAGLPERWAAVAGLGGHRLQLPATSEGERLRAALIAYAAWHRTHASS